MGKDPPPTFDTTPPTLLLLSPMRAPGKNGEIPSRSRRCIRDARVMFCSTWLFSLHCNFCYGKELAGFTEGVISSN
jgi:hypothetical protein